MLRHASRHLARTVTDRITEYLTSLGWTTVPPFGTTPVEIVTRRFRESEMQALTGNKVGLFFAEESPDEAAELGGGLMQNRTTLFADVIAVNDGVGLALAGDIKDLLTGRVIGWPRMIKMRDYTTDTAGEPLENWIVEFVEVRRERPSADLRAQFWQVVTADIELTFPGEE